MGAEDTILDAWATVPSNVPLLCLGARTRVAHTGTGSMVRERGQVGGATADADSEEEGDMEMAERIVHGRAASADGAEFLGPLPLAGNQTRRAPAGQGLHRGGRDPCATRWLWRAVAVACALLAASALGAQALSRPHTATIHTIAVGRWPDALAIAPGAGRAFVADDAGATVSVLDLDSGRAIRTVAVGRRGALTPLALTLAAHAHRLFVATAGDSGAPSVVRLLDTGSGAVRATVRVGPEASALGVDERAGHVLVGTEGDGRVGLLDARTGRLLRTTRVGLAPLALTVDPRTARAFVPGTVLLPTEQPADGQTGLVGVLDTRTGALVRTVVVGYGVYGVGALAVDARAARVFVANSLDNTVSVLDARTGVLLRTVRVGRAPAALAVDARAGRVFVVNEDAGTLSVLDARTGALRRTVAAFPATTISVVTQPYALAVDATRARVYVTAWGRLDRAALPTGSGQLAILDARSGRLLRTIEVGVAPQAVAVQEESGRVVVVDSGGVLRAPVGWLERGVRHVAQWVPELGRLVPHAPDAIVAPGRVEVIDPGRGAG